MAEILACKYSIETFFPECRGTISDRNNHDKYAKLCWPEDFSDIVLLCYGPLEADGGYALDIVEYMMHRTNLCMSNRFENKHDWEVKVPHNLRATHQPQGIVLNYLNGDIHEFHEYGYTSRDTMDLTYSLKTSSIIRYLQYGCPEDRDSELLEFQSRIVPNILYQNEYSFKCRAWYDDSVIQHTYHIKQPTSYLKGMCELGVVHKRNYACTDKENCYYYGGYEYHCPKRFLEALNLALYLCLVLVERRKQTIYKNYYSNNDQSWWYMKKSQSLLLLADKVSNHNCLTFEMQKTIINKNYPVLFYSSFV